MKYGSYWKYKEAYVRLRQQGGQSDAWAARPLETSGSIAADGMVQTSTVIRRNRNSTETEQMGSPDPWFTPSPQQHTDTHADTNNASVMSIPQGTGHWFTRA